MPLGDMYRAGKGVPKDVVQAHKWYNLAAAVGGSNAYATALREFRPLAEQGNAFAQRNLGFMYMSGQGLPADYAEAARWYGKAAEQGNASAQEALSDMYRAGKGVPKDVVQAHKWYNLAAAVGRSDAWWESRSSVEKEMTPAQIAKAQRGAREWWAAFEMRKAGKQ